MSRLRDRLALAARLAAGALLQTGPAATRDPIGPPQAPMRRYGATRGASNPGLVKELTPARVASYLEAANNGDTRSFAELCRQIQDRDTHIVAVLGVRKRAVVNLPWSLKPASDDRIDREIAEFCTKQIRQMARLRAGMLGLLDAVMTGYAGAEIEWELRGGRVVPKRLMYRPTEWIRPDPDDFEAWRVLDEADPVYGVPLVANKWVLHVAQAKSGWPVESGLGRVLVWWYLFKSYGVKDWASYNEKFGSPFRIGKYPVGTEDDDIVELEEALQQLGIDAYATMPDDMDVSFPADNSGKTGGATHEPFLAFANKEISKVVLGSTLTVEGGPTGIGSALGTVHNDVRADIRDSDALELQETLTRDLVRPMVEFNWGASALIPEWVFEISPAPDRKADAEAQDARGRVFTAARALGVEVPVAQVREELNIRAPEPGEAVLPPLSPAAGPAPFRGSVAYAIRGGGVVYLTAAEYHRVQLPAAERAVGEVSAVVAFERIIDRFRGAIAAAWKAIVAQLRTELGDHLERASLQDRLAAALGQLDVDPYVDELAAARLHAEALGLAQMATPTAPVALPKLPTTSPLVDVDGWAAAVGSTPEAWAANVATQKAEARKAVQNALLRTAQELVDAVDATADAPLDAARNALQAAQDSPHRTDGVLDGAMSSQWGEGRWKGLTTNASQRLYLRYHTKGDDAVRPSHRVMDGKVYPADHPIWQAWRPPNGYGCRCWVTAHTRAEVDAMGWTITEDYPSLDDGTPAVPDAGWQRHHGEADYAWDRFPSSWKDALAVREERAG